MTGALSDHYARALADTVFRPDSGLAPEEAVQQLKNAESLLTGSRDLQLALLSPAVSKSRKIAVVAQLSDSLGLNRLVRNFLMVIVAHRRVHELKAMRQSFENEIDERLGWVRAEITSATDLSAPQREQIERALGAKLGKFIRADYQTDPSVLGGVRARVASREYDATLRGKLESMRQQLRAGA